MLNYFAKRILIILVTLFGVSIIIFSLIHFMPGDPIQFMFGKNQDKASIEMIQKYYGLDKPILQQYFIWLSKIIRLDLGTSIASKVPVLELIGHRVGRSMLLAITGLLSGLVISIPFGIISGYKHNTFLDFGISSLALLLMSLPEFWIGIVLILIFAVNLAILPAGDFIPSGVNFVGFLKSLILPSISIGCATMAYSSRMLRTTIIEVLQKDYILFAKAYGINPRRIIFIHAFRNALIPVVTVIGLTFGFLLGGVVIIERVFNYPGLGLLMLDAIMARDYPLIQAVILIFSGLFIFVTFIVDILYGFINPKIKYN